MLTLSHPFRVATKWLLDLFYPPRCAGCGRFGAFFCSDCDSRCTEPVLDHCPGCGRPQVNDLYCPRCRASGVALNGLTTTTDFCFPIRPALHQFKYRGVTALADPLAVRLARYWGKKAVAVDAVIPVPLHRSRLRERGYNQAALLAAPLAKLLKTEYFPSALRRTRATGPQVGLTRDERLQNVANAFVAQRQFNGMRILLIDDVCTTGATLAAAAGALEEAGAPWIWGLTVARANVAGDQAFVRESIDF